MDNAHNITRRSILSGMPFAALALSVPAFASTPVAAASALPGLVDAYRSAALAADVALEARSRVEDAYNQARPRYYADTPVIGQVDVEMIGPAGVRKLYADYGPVLIRKGHDPDELLAVALDNHAKAWERIEAGKAAAGVTAAKEAFDGAIEVQKSTFAAIVAHVPVSRADASDKVAFLLSQFEDDPYFVFTPDELQTLFKSFATGA